jgi:methionyl aminopeptidase
MAILLKTPAEIEKMRQSGQVLRQVHEAIRPLVVPGASTMDLEQVAAAKMDVLRAIPAFKGYHGYPAVLCTSVNSEVVHGIPSPTRVLHEGDIVSIDCGVIVGGFYSDCAVTYAVGTASVATRKLLEVTQAALENAVLEAQVGNRLGDISAAVQELCESQGYGVVKEFVGHGIGRSMHEDPQVPNFGARGKGPRLKAGMVLAIEPMINAGKPEVRVLPDGWTTVTVDGSLSAHFEHTVAITKDGPQVLTR